MKKLAFFLGLYSTLLFSQELQEHSRYQILVSDPTTSTVTEQSFNTVPRVILALNQIQLNQKNIKVDLNLNWETPYFSAWVKQEALNHYSLNFWGGITRIPGMNENALALIACHEMGHILGGEPLSNNRFEAWASSEGQSDYYATGVCLKNYLKLFEASGKLEEPVVDNTLYTRCLTTYPESSDFLLCLNIMDGIEGFSHVLHHLDPEKEKMSFSKKSPKAKVTKTDSYPEAQCRIETLIAGNFCSKDKFPCLNGEGSRPQCWFVD